ncbi:MAG: hypothetical protein E7059_07760 [Treponema bryantii]|nr:hypothetical protein [Treponema bryantii]
MKKKLIICFTVFMALIGFVFGASCYKYRYTIQVRCPSCDISDTFTVDADDDKSARTRAERLFSCKDRTHHSGRYDNTIITKETLDYTICN